jgi:hypothetical protein
MSEGFLKKNALERTTILLQHVATRKVQLVYPLRKHKIL